MSTWNKELAMQRLGLVEIDFDNSGVEHHPNGEGFSNGNCIAINPKAEFPEKVLFHELAHHALGHTAMTAYWSQETPPTAVAAMQVILDRPACEVEAESVAGVLCGLAQVPKLAEQREAAVRYCNTWLRRVGRVNEQGAMLAMLIALKEGPNVVRALNPKQPDAEACMAATLKIWQAGFEEPIDTEAVTAAIGREVQYLGVIARTLALADAEPVNKQPA